MPIHDWTRVSAGTFHNFHLLWISAITNRLNAGLLPTGYFAMAEQFIGQPAADVATIDTSRRPLPYPADNGATMVAAPPQTTFVFSLDEERYAPKANRVAIHHSLGDVVAVVEILSPGNKSSRHAIQQFISKALDLLWQCVNLLLVDLFPPGARDPQGIHAAIWNEVSGQAFSPPMGKPLTAAAYQTNPVKTAYVEPLGVGDPLPDMPLFLQQEWHVLLPLEETYLVTWSALPAELRRSIEVDS